jgi:hypothetical protein
MIKKTMHRQHNAVKHSRGKHIEPIEVYWTCHKVCQQGESVRGGVGTSTGSTVASHRE